MKRGGYDSYRPDEALRQAEEHGENVGWDRAFGVAGSIAEGIWLAILTTIVAYFACQALALLGDALPGMIVTAFMALFAPRIADWMVRPFGDSLLRRFLWGLTAAATLLLLVRVMSALLIVVWLRLQGQPADQAGIGAFHGAAQFTLAIAMPVWILYAIWGWMRRRSLQQHISLPAWRRALPFFLIVAMMILLGREGAYFDALNGTTLGLRPIRL